MTSSRSTTPASTRPAPVAALHLGKGDPVLLLHGFLLSPHCWEQVARRMSSHCEVYAPAFAGHWGGPELRGWSLDVYALADQIESQLDELGWQTCHIAGNSLGGWVGLELARRGRARTLTAIAPAGGWGSPSLTAVRVGLKFASLIPFVAVGRRLGAGIVDNAIIQQVAALVVAKSTSSVPRRDLTNMLSAVLGCDAMIPMLLGSLRAPAMQDLDELSTPVRLLLAEYDRVIPNHVYATRYLRDLPENADRILVHGVGHVPMLESPDRIATLIAEHIYASRGHLRAV
ncbi:alpha/beta fold hydrolase [Nocardia camponoti]|uniref:Alpha/beta hydrolase n=1 Tax=Nocardia camponoti TaxID=1616106 RepID=A0A917QME6_9NOCA|nr:alpha/beta hydrolase [Nocardia camponoti]GGK56678.1 alpha/beta hydrolase [Nocardia camponoti]